MSQTQSLELSDRQREMLLRGLRFVRRSYTLEFRDTSEITEDQRAEALREVQELNRLLEGGRATMQPAGAR
jgi:hypothetical protein